MLTAHPALSSLFRIHSVYRHGGLGDRHCFMLTVQMGTLRPGTVSFPRPHGWQAVAPRFYPGCLAAVSVLSAIMATVSQRGQEARVKTNWRRSSSKLAEESRVTS